jgi:hypothetical protein
MRSFGEGACHLYADSVHAANGCVLFLAKALGEKFLWIMEKEAGADSSEFEGVVMIVNGRNVRKAPLSHANAVVIRRWFSFARPTAFGREGVSIGLGDRLGIASPGHLRIIRKTKARPVLAQQSIRELNLTDRTYEDVLDSASWAVFQEGYHLGFGADGDHLKTAAEVRQALDLEFSMITLDCSEKIDNQIATMTKSEIAAAIALYMTCGDMEWGAEVYGCASDRQQASIVFDVAVDMVDQCPALKKRIKPIMSVKRLVYKPTNSYYQVLSSEAFTKHGLNVHGVVFDELHAQPNRDLYDVMTKGSGDARTQPLFFLITTAGTDRNSICFEVHQKAEDIIAGRRIDPTFYPVIYGISDEADWADEANWYKANPSLGITIDIEKVRNAYNSAKDNPTDSA